jgi:hypothetical protein
VTADRRPIEPEMQLLWARLETVCATFDDLIGALVGSRRGFTLLVHPKDPDNATLSVTNTMSNVEAVRDWVTQMDARTTAGRLSDDLLAATYGGRDKYIEVCEANFAARKRETFAEYIAQQSGLGIPLLAEKEWSAAHEYQLETMRTNIEVNQ